jgi:hypothetical protein
MRALINFINRGGCSLHIHILAADSRTILVGHRKVRNTETLLRVVAKLGGDVALAEADIRRSDRGSVWIDLTPAQCEFFGIVSPAKIPLT